MPVTSDASAREQLLIQYHRAHAGATQRAFGPMAVTLDGVSHASSYAALAAEADGAAQVLDLGCGDGALIAALLARAPRHHVAGLDLSDDELALARVALPSTVELRHGRAQALPFADAAFDAVLSHLALMLMEAPSTVLAEVHRVLRPGGRIGTVVGMAPITSAPLELFLRCLRAEARLPAYQGLRFSDPAFGSDDGIQALFAPHFVDIDLRALHFGGPRTPPQLWAWFAAMYDLFTLDAAAALRVERAFLAEAPALCGADGTFAYVDRLRLITAQRRSA